MSLARLSVYKNVGQFVKSNGVWNRQSLNLSARNIHFASRVKTTKSIRVINRVSQNLVLNSHSNLFTGNQQFRFFASDLPPSKAITMPALSPTMTKGTLLSWIKKEGDQVRAGDELCQIETDKANMSFEASDEGYIAKILVPEKTEGIDVGTPIALLVEDKADVEKFKDYKPSPPTASAQPAEQVAAKEAKPEPAPAKEAKPEPATAKEAPKSSAPPAPQPVQPVQQVKPATPTSQGDRIFASPAARVAAEEKGIDLRTLSGTGPNQRVLKADVLEAPVAAAPQAVASAPLPTPVPAAPGAAYTDIPLSNIRKVIASRLSLSKQTIPHYYLTIECAVDKLLKVRAELNANAGKDAPKISVNDFIIKAAALALRKVPEVNSQWTETAIRRFHTVDVNVAVNTPHGLFTPLIANTDTKGLLQINAEVRQLAEKAKENKLSPKDSQIGTFTISNLGMFGITTFAAVINPPQAAILAVGAVDKRVVVAGKQADGSSKFAEKSILNVTISCDHRVIDGAIGAQWLSAFKSYVEEPISMLL